MSQRSPLALVGIALALAGRALYHGKTADKFRHMKLKSTDDLVKQAACAFPFLRVIVFYTGSFLHQTMCYNKLGIWYIQSCPPIIQPYAQK